VRVYGDSLGLPREEVGVTPVDTYAERFKEAVSTARGRKVLLYNRSRGGATIDVLRREFVADSPYFGRSTRGILIVQCGIVDCAPRPIPRWLRSAISKLPVPVRAPIVYFLHHNRGRLLRLGPSWRLTSPGRFRGELQKWLATAATQVEEIFVLTIAPTTTRTEAHSPGLSASIDSYNAVVRQVVEEARPPAGARICLVDVHAALQAVADDQPPCVSPDDGHHLTCAGHALYAALLMAAAARSDLPAPAAPRPSGEQLS
jgi:hypothetical protein